VPASRYDAPSPSQLNALVESARTISLRTVSADALLRASVNIYLRAHPAHWRRLRAQLVRADIGWLPMQRGWLHHRRLWCTRGGQSRRPATKFVANDRKTDQLGRKGLMTSATSDARPSEQHRVLTDLIRRQAGVASPASDHLTVDQPSLMAPPDQLPLVADRLHEILITGGTFDPIYRPILAALPPPVDDAALRGHHERVAGAKTGTLSNVE
jgi:hypothetical protein